MLRGSEGIGNRDSLPDEPVLHVFGQEQVAIRFRCGTQNHGIPYTELMRNGKISRSENLRRYQGQAFGDPV